MTDPHDEQQKGSGGALDPHEKWGQGTDASHPVSAIDAVDADTPTVDTMAGTTSTLDDGEMTETAERLRRTSGADAHADLERQARQVRPRENDIEPDDDLPLT